MGYPIRINICHWERSNAENPDTESVVSKMEITAAYGKGFTARSILKLLATDSKIQSGQRQIMHRICLASVSVGEAMAGGRKTTKIGALRVQTNKSAAIYKLRLIFLS